MVTKHFAIMDGDRVLGMRTMGREDWEGYVPPAGDVEIDDATRATVTIGATIEDDGTFTAPAVVTVKHLSRNAFMNRFRQAEWLTLKAARATVPAMEYWWDQYESAAFVDLNDARVAQGLAGAAQVLVGAGVWTNQTAVTRLAEIQSWP